MCTNGKAISLFLKTKSKSTKTQTIYCTCDDLDFTKSGMERWIINNICRKSVWNAISNKYFNEIHHISNHALFQLNIINNGVSLFFLLFGALLVTHPIAFNISQALVETAEFQIVSSK